MKAVILTCIPENKTEKELLRKTKIYKLALNHHCAELIPDARIISDYVLKNIYQNFPEKIITVRDKSIRDNSRIECFESDFKGATILSAIDYLISKNFDQILITGTNTVHNPKFRTLINEEIGKIKDGISIYQYTKGNFNLPVMTINEFCK